MVLFLMMAAVMFFMFLCHEKQRVEIELMRRQAVYDQEKRDAVANGEDVSDWVRPVKGDVV
jgi:hypothetical protein